ncbi:siroheme decarboxylase subunit beta [Desulfoscipio gibsoniae]|uniref:siroheme decarboxylase n=1 Tax=Desulfoscipio gibsoniae DSM 7213 TaxID=767817 RepID=R4KG03_9FIRM|nr:Lrp/AsnC family transcriptional regulator [Desulfoscipio gibsoniae]AGL01504.1 transcriptional regulator [Desulfoscipio gibsoniae DSM 7213]
MLTELEKQIVRELQKGLPLVSRPYLDIARRIGLTENELMNKINEMISNGIIRRFGAAVRHQKLGYTANAMVVWDVPEDRVETTGRQLAGFPEVTHCYQRPRRPGWPYTLFTVIHGHTREQCEQLAAAMAAKIGLTNYMLLFSTTELKKSSMQYFID